MHGVLWLLPDKLPKRLRPSLQLVRPVCEDEEISLREDWCEVKSIGHRAFVYGCFPCHQLWGVSIGLSQAISQGKALQFLVFYAEENSFWLLESSTALLSPAVLCPGCRSLWKLDTARGLQTALGTPPATGSACALQTEQPRNIQGTRLSRWESGNLSAGGKCCCCGSTGPRAGASPAFVSSLLP